MHTDIHNHSEFNVDFILARLRKEGMRITHGRRGVLEVLFRAERPLSLLEIQERVVALGVEKPDYATVFRVMTLLESLRMAQKVNLQKSCSYFELRDPSKHYDHLVCRDCGKVIVLENPCPVAEVEKQLASRYGFTMVSHSLEFFGKCPVCQEKN